MSFTEAIRTCFSKYATFSGRAIRSEYWWWVLFVIAVSIVLGIIDAAIFGTGSDSVGVFGAVFSLAILIPGFAVTARRLHDRGFSGWWQVGPYILVILTGVFAGMNAWILAYASGAGAAVIGILLLIWLIQKGNDGENRFGPDPLGGSDAPPSDYSRSSIPKSGD